MNQPHLQKKPWYSLPVETAFLTMHSSEEGISDEAAKNLAKIIGLNVIQKKQKESFLKFFALQFASPLIYVLIFSMVIAFSFGKIVDGCVILAVVLLNTFIGAIQEYKSSCAIHALGQTVDQMALVIRSGVQKKIPVSEVTLGDVVVLEPGERICADVRLFSCKNLACDEAVLTGESLPVFKRIDPVSMESIVADRKSMAYSGTLVSSGYGKGVVVAIGMETEFGKIASLLQSVVSLKTPLSIALDRLAKTVTGFVFFMCLGSFATAYFRGYSLVEGAFTSVALGVAAIPEGLPAIITITAAIGVGRMAKKNSIIRHLVAVETLGSTTVICTDKTGTLTENKMKVKSLIFLENEKEAIIGSILCNTASSQVDEKQRKYHGDPTENALLMYGHQKGLNENEVRNTYSRIDMIPFDPERRWMASMHQMEDGKRVIFIKGAPEVILEKVRMEPAKKKELEKDLLEMASKGYRTLAVAAKEMPSFRHSCEEEDIEEGFSLLGLFGMEDPPREGVDQAIKTCQQAGIAVKMITGDHPVTAKKIAKEIGIQHPENVLTGEQLDQLSEDELEEKIPHVNVFARTLPHHKLKIVQILQKLSEVVAMTGDGVNDAPSLKQADIGISMGVAGTSVAKEASDMVLIDDNFTTIELAVEEGRRVYDNLVKSILFIFPTNLAQSLTVIAGVLFFPVINQKLLMPILPVQILWVNLIVAVALALPLAFEVIEPNIMQREPRKPKSPILSRPLLIRTFFIGMMVMLGTVGAFFTDYALAQDAQIAEKYAQTSAVTTLVFFQIFYLFKCRAFNLNIFTLGLFSNRYLIWGVLVTVIAQLAFVEVPAFQSIFQTTSLSLRSYLMSIAWGWIIIPLVDLEHWIVKKLGIHE